MEVLEAIYARRSVREFTDEQVDQESARQILEAGSWAPSGLNNQPWRFVIVRDPAMKKSMAQLTRYHKIVLSAPLLIAVFMDHEEMYNHLKDSQGIGACLQNILLAAHALGLGGVWLGEILNRANDVRNLLELSEQYELMAVAAIGHPAPVHRASSRKAVAELVIKEI